MPVERSLKINAVRLGYPVEVAAFLRALESAYNHIYALELLEQEATRRFTQLSPSRVREPRLGRLSYIPRPDNVVAPVDRIVLRSVVIQSPGFWEVLGTLNPLETIRKYLCDRHERSKDRDFRNAQEAEKGRAEIDGMRMAALEQRANLLRQFGVPEDKIRDALMRHLVRPLSTLDEFQDHGIVTDAQELEVLPKIGKENVSDEMTE